MLSHVSTIQESHDYILDIWHRKCLVRSILDLENDRIRKTACDVTRVLDWIGGVQRSGEHQHWNRASDRMRKLDCGSIEACRTTEVIRQERIIDRHAEGGSNTFSCDKPPARPRT